MTKFDSYIAQLFTEMGEMGKGGLANQGPAVTNAAPTQQSATGSSPSTMNKPKIPLNTNTSPSGQQNAAIDVNAILNDKSTKWGDFLSKDYNKKALNTHVVKTLMDSKTDPQMRDNLIKTISTTPDLNAYFGDFVNTLSQ